MTVLLQFVDTNGIARVAPISNGDYKKLIAAATYYQDRNTSRPYSRQTMPYLRAWAALCDLAGVEKPYPRFNKENLMRMHRKAKRKCHPDTEGTHDLWLKLQELEKELGL